MSRTLRLRSDLSELRRLRAELRRAADREHFSPEAAFDIVLSVHEAVVNAMTHGNRLRPERSVTVRWRYDSDSLAVTVSDEGEGFDHEGWVAYVTHNIPGPDMEHGRGILLMTHLMDSLTFENGGATVILRRRYDRRVPCA